MVMNNEMDTRTFYAGSVIAVATILMAVSIFGSGLFIPNQIIASIGNTIEEKKELQ